MDKCYYFDDDGTKIEMSDGELEAEINRPHEPFRFLVDEMALNMNHDDSDIEEIDVDMDVENFVEDDNAVMELQDVVEREDNIMEMDDMDLQNIDNAGDGLRIPADLDLDTAPPNDEDEHNEEEDEVPVTSMHFLRLRRREKRNKVEDVREKVPMMQEENVRKENVAIQVEENDGKQKSDKKKSNKGEIDCDPDEGSASWQNRCRTLGITGPPPGWKSKDLEALMSKASLTHSECMRVAHADNQFYQWLQEEWTPLYLKTHNGKVLDFNRNHTKLKPAVPKKLKWEAEEFEKNTKFKDKEVAKAVKELAAFDEEQKKRPEREKKEKTKEENKKMNANGSGSNTTKRASSIGPGPAVKKPSTRNTRSTSDSPGPSNSAGPSNAPGPSNTTYRTRSRR